MAGPISHICKVLPNQSDLLVACLLMDTEDKNPALLTSNAGQHMAVPRTRQATGFGKPVLTTSGHQKMTPPNSFRLHLILGEEERTCYKAKMWLLDGVFPTSPKRKPHTLRKRENVHLPKQQNKTNGDSGRR
ncbi:uncharacterized protein LOC144320615 [Canis aureus]